MEQSFSADMHYFYGRVKNYISGLPLTSLSHSEKSRSNFPKAFHNRIIVIWAIVLLKQATLNFSHLLGPLSHSAPLSLSDLVGREGC